MRVRHYDAAADRYDLEPLIADLEQRPSAQLRQRGKARMSTARTKCVECQVTHEEYAALAEAARSQTISAWLER